MEARDDSLVMINLLLTLRICSFACYKTRSTQKHHMLAFGLKKDTMYHKQITITRDVIR